MTDLLRIPRTQGAIGRLLFSAALANGVVLLAGLADAAVSSTPLLIRRSYTAAEILATAAGAPPALTHPVALAPRGRARPAPGLAKGKFLVASRHLTDRNFSQTVVLLIDYDVHGAMGVVINRPTDLRLSTLLPQVDQLRERTDIVYLGGPVARGRLVLLIRSRRKPEASGVVLDNVYVSSSLTALRRVIERGGPGEEFHAHVGYAGWGPRQLDAEVARGDWYVLRADAETVFNTAPSEIWPALIRRAAGQWARERGAEQLPLPIAN